MNEDMSPSEIEDKLEKAHDQMENNLIEWNETEAQEVDSLQISISDSSADLTKDKKAEQLIEELEYN